MKTYLTVVAILLSISFSFAQNRYNITDFGAKADSTVINTQAIQKAIDLCVSNGGGTVFIPSGTFITGTIFLKSNVVLSLEPASVLLGSPDFKDYKNRALIYAEDQENIAVIGTGTINGNGAHPNFKSADPMNGLPGRPETIKFRNCRSVKLGGFNLRDGATHCIELIECIHVTVDDLNVSSRVVANNDGLDIIDCQYVKVSNSYFDCGDDAICPKSDSPLGVKHLVIMNCILKSESNAIKFGTGSAGAFQDITISNCVIRDTRLSGIALEVVDGGLMDRVIISNITMHNVDGAIFIRIGQRKGDNPGILKNVIINNVIADGIGLWKPETENSYFKDDKDTRIGISIVGQPGFDIENITFSNIYLQFAGGGTLEDAGRIMQDTPEEYPEYTNFGITPAYGFNCKHVKNIVFDNVQLEWINHDDRPSLFFEDVKKLSISNLKSMVSPEAKSFIRLKDVANVLIQGCKPDEVNIPFLSLEGQTKDVSVLNNDLRKVKRTFIAETSVNRNELIEK